MRPSSPLPGRTKGVEQSLAQRDAIAGDQRDRQPEVER